MLSNWSIASRSCQPGTSSSEVVLRRVRPRERLEPPAPHRLPPERHAVHSRHSQISEPLLRQTVRTADQQADVAAAGHPVLQLHRQFAGGPRPARYLERHQQCVAGGSGEQRLAFLAHGPGDIGVLAEARQGDFFQFRFDIDLIRRLAKVLYNRVEIYQLPEFW